MNSKRVPNFTKMEKNLLADLVARHPATTSRKTDQISRRSRKNAWEKLEEEFNSSGIAVCLRNYMTLQKCWKNMEVKAKARSAERRREFRKTGGGPEFYEQSDSVLDKVEGRFQLKNI